MAKRFDSRNRVTMTHADRKIQNNAYAQEYYWTHMYWNYWNSTEIILNESNDRLNLHLHSGSFGTGDKGVRGESNAKFRLRQFNGTVIFKSAKPISFFRVFLEKRNVKTVIIVERKIDQTTE